MSVTVNLKCTKSVQCFIIIRLKNFYTSGKNRTVGMLSQPPGLNRTSTIKRLGARFVRKENLSELGFQLLRERV